MPDDVVAPDADAAMDAAIAEASTAAPAEPEVAPAAPAVQPPAKPVAQPRDDAGRFVPKAPQPKAPSAPDAAPPPAPETPSEPTAAAAPAADEEAGPPFSYQADGRSWEIPGTEVGEDGVFISKDALPELNRLLAQGKSHEGSFRQRLTDSAQQVQAATKRVEAAEAARAHLLKHFDDLIDRSQGAQTIEDLLKTPLGEWLLNVYSNWPILKAESAKRAVEVQAEADRARLKEFEQQQEQARMAPIMDQTLQDSIVYWGQQAGLDRAVLQRIYARLSDPQYQSLLFVRAPTDDPATGLREGELAINHAVVQQEVEYAKGWASEAKPKPTPKPAAAVPPTVSGKGGPAPVGTKKKPPTPKDMSEAEFWEAFDKDPSLGLVE